MRVIATARSIVLIVAMMLLNGIGLVGQTSGLGMTQHSMQGSHAQTKTAGCVNSCSTYPTKTEDIVTQIEQKEEPSDLPVAPAYLVVYLPDLISTKIAHEKLATSLLFRPPDIPVVNVAFRY